MAKRTKRKTTKKFNLREFVLQEAQKLSGEAEAIEKTKAQEYEAGEEAGQLELDIDFIKALKIKESKIRAAHQKLVKEMRKVQLKKRAVKKRIIKKI